MLRSRLWSRRVPSGGTQGFPGPARRPGPTALKLRFPSESSRIPKNSGGCGQDAIFANAPNSWEFGYCVLFNSEKEEWEHDVTRNLLVEPSGKQTHPVTLAGGRKRVLRGRHVRATAKRRQRWGVCGD